MSDDETHLDAEPAGSSGTSDGITGEDDIAVKDSVGEALSCGVSCGATVNCEQEKRLHDDLNLTMMSGIRDVVVDSEGR